MVRIGLLPIVLLAKGNSIGSRSLIREYVLDASLLTPGNRTKTINGVLPRNG